MKLGQLLSTRPDVLPAEFPLALATLQQHVPPVPWDDIRPGSSDPSAGRQARPRSAREPFAAASIGQVHAAVLQSGERVAVKVRRPGIVPLIERDMDIAARLARRLARSADWAARSVSNNS